MINNKCNIYFLLSLLLCACSNISDKASAGSFEVVYEKCFASHAKERLDTNLVVGCVNTFYKLVNADYLLEIQLPSATINRCNLKMAEYNIKAFLHIYEPGEAHLANKCTDLFISNYPKPIRELASNIGVIDVGFGNPKELWGVMLNHGYLNIDVLKFQDDLLDQEIVIEHELFWKVLNLPPAG